MRKCLEDHRALLGRVLERIRDEIAEDLVEKLRIAHESVGKLSDLRQKLAPYADLRIVACEIVDHLLQIERTGARAQVSLSELHGIHQARDEGRHTKGC